MPYSSKVESAKRLANYHLQVEPRLTRVFLLGPIRDEDPREPIKLLEVVEDAIESGVEPISFPADSANGIHFPSIIVELSPREFATIPKDGIHFRDRVWTIEEDLTHA